MPRLLIVYHTQTGGTEALAAAAMLGASGIAETQTIVKRAADAHAGDLLAADGLLLGTPENFGYMSGMLKDFFDRVYYACENSVMARPYSVFVCAGNDGTGAMREVDRIGRYCAGTGVGRHACRRAGAWRVLIAAGAVLHSVGLVESKR